MAAVVEAAWLVALFVVLNGMALAGRTLGEDPVESVAVAALVAAWAYGLPGGEAVVLVACLWPPFLEALAKGRR